MSDLHPGLYEILVTKLIAAQLENLAPGVEAATSPLTPAETADRLALHLSRIVEQAVNALHEDQRRELGAQLAHQLCDAVAKLTGRDDFEGLRLAEPLKVLRAIQAPRPDGNVEAIDAPMIPLLDTTILTNAKGEPHVGHQLQREIASADRIDVVMAFIRRSGINPLKVALSRYTAKGGQLRVLTTVYTGSTEAAALEELERLGAKVRVSYDKTGTRLHAKAWLFHRESGHSTAYVGSSNLTHSAQVTGLEWNVRLSEARNRPVIEKIGAVFESYWQQPEFERYDSTRFAAAVAAPLSRSDEVLSPLEVRLEPFQERLLEQVALSRQRGYHRNLLVSATGTGKTVMAAVDYAALRTGMTRARLLFVAHREEILAQSLRTFRQVLQDGAFGELWVGGHRPQQFEHVFASIQSLAAAGTATLDAEHFDVVIVDEFHHAAAATYERLLAHLRPKELLGLTATPERADGQPILQWFDNRCAAELRLWDAIDQHRLVPFAYFGIADDLDLRAIPWRRGVGYDVDRLTEVITATDMWAKRIVRQWQEHLAGSQPVCALGFCVSVAHARYMASVFAAHGIAAVAVWADSSEAERHKALRDLKAGAIQVVFAVDLFNEGVDVPSVNALLMLRPTESPLLFLQQLGRGLRKSSGKAVCTVLDFVGQHRAEFRYDLRLRALLGGSRKHVEAQAEAGFPFLPAGCSMNLDPIASERVLESIRRALPSTWPRKVQELIGLGATNPDISLSEFLAGSGLELPDIYANNRSWSDLRQAAGLPVLAEGPNESVIRRAIGRLVHVDDAERVKLWREWAGRPVPPDPEGLTLRGRRLLRMLLTQLLNRVEGDLSLSTAATRLWEHPQARRELVELLVVLEDGIGHLSIPLKVFPQVPLVVHARYTRLEILAATASTEGVRVATWQEGVRFEESLPADLLVFTLDKTSGRFSPTTRYRDYAISQDLIHWESQSMLRPTSPTGERYQHHVAGGSHILLFARLNDEERAFVFLGPASYVSHTGEMPMAITWRLEHRLPGDLFEKFVAAVA